MIRSRLGSYLFMVATAAIVPVSAIHFLLAGGDAPIGGAEHMAIVVTVSAIAGLASGGLILFGARSGDSNAVVSGAAFAAMSLLLLIHGMATPGVLVSGNPLIGFAGGLALPVGGGLLALTAIPALRAPHRARAVGAAMAGVLLLIAAGGIIGFAFPGSVPESPSSGDDVAIVLMIVGLGFFSLIAWRAVHTFALTRRRADAVVVVGVVWLGVALIPSMVLSPGTWAWWMGHILEFLGVTLVAIPVAIDVLRPRPSRPLTGDLSATELVRAEEAFLGGRVKALMTRLEEKDVSTEQHTRRVAELAVQIGESVGLSPGRLRDLALAGILHDMGKLTVPDEVLTKPGPLTDEEFAIVRRHPEWGDELLSELGYGPRVRAVVRGHHERLDGSGYPDGLRGEQIGLDTRILAVADVYDAMVSSRVYRAAWEPGDVLAHLREDSGTQFDPRCVEALEAIVGPVRAVSVA